MSHNQFGFRPGCSTTMAAGADNHDWHQAKTDKKSCGALQFDLSAAFDCINVDILMEKIRIYGGSELVLKLIRSYLTGRCQVVEYDGQVSETIDILIGSPQGSGLSPLLYLILVADQNEWITTGYTQLYADDTIGYVIAASKKEVKESLTTMAKEVLTFMKATRLKANPEKTRYIMFGSSIDEPIPVGGVLVEASKDAEFLGFTFNKRLTWKSQIEKTEAELSNRIGILSRLAWNLPRDVVISMIDPIFTFKLRYGLELLIDITEPNTDPVLKRGSLPKGTRKKAPGKKAPKKRHSAKRHPKVKGTLSMKAPEKRHSAKRHPY